MRARPGVRHRAAALLSTIMCYMEDHLTQVREVSCEVSVVLFGHLDVLGRMHTLLLRQYCAAFSLAAWAATMARCGACRAWLSRGYVILVVQPLCTDVGGLVWSLCGPGRIRAAVAAVHSWRGVCVPVCRSRWGVLCVWVGRAAPDRQLRDQATARPISSLEWDSRARALEVE